MVKKPRLSKLLYGIEVRGLTILKNSASRSLIITVVSKKPRASEAPTRHFPAGQVLKYDWDRETWEHWIGQPSITDGVMRDGPVSEATIISPGRIAGTPDGTLYFLDGPCLRKVTNEGLVVTVIGQANAPVVLDERGEDEPEPLLSSPVDLVSDKHGQIYIADEGSKRIRILDRTGTLYTVAGSGLCGSADGPALESTFSDFGSLTLDEDRGLLYVAEYESQRVRKLDLATRTVSTVFDVGELFAFNYHPCCACSSPGGSLVFAVYCDDADEYRHDHSHGALCSSIYSFNPNSGIVTSIVGRRDTPITFRMRYVVCASSVRMYIIGEDACLYEVLTAEGIPPPPPRPPSSTMAEDYSSLLTTPAGLAIADTTICVGSSRFSAHRTVLAARCTYFASLFASDFVESKSDTFELRDIDPEAFSALLTYLYTDRLEFEPHVLPGLLHLGRMCLLDRVSLHCRRAMFEALQPENALRWYVWSCDNDEAELREAALKLMRRAPEACLHAAAADGGLLADLMRSRTDLVIGVVMELVSSAAAGGTKRARRESGAYSTSGGILATLTPASGGVILRDED